eukprot:gene4611-4514_t
MEHLPLHPKTVEFLSRRSRMLIGAEWMDAASGATMAQQDRVHNYIEMGRELGATIACGGEKFGPGYFVQPTVIVDTVMIKL